MNFISNPATGIDEAMVKIETKSWNTYQKQSLGATQYRRY